IVAQSNSIVLGNNASVGIGTTAPQAKLHVANPGGTAGQFDGDVTINGNLSASGISNLTLAAGSVTQTQLSNGSVGTAQLVNNAVTASKIDSGQVVKNI